MENSFSNTRNNTRLALLLGIMFILTFTPFGFIVIPPISITILHIPVIIGAITIGLRGSIFLGISFGVLSLVKATFFAVTPVDMMFSPFLSGYPIQSIFLSVVTRLLFAVFAALLFKFLCKTRIKMSLAIGIVAGVSSAVHTILVLGCLSLLFSAMPLKEVFLTIVTFNGLMEIAVAVLFSVPVCKILLNKKN